MKRGFTLIELLVVVAIIVVLLTLLTPALQKAIEETEMLVCQNNFRTLYMATYFYTSDNKKVFMNQQRPTTADQLEPAVWWGTDLLQYGTTREGYHCPSFGGTRTDYGVTWSWSFGPHFVGYGYNAYFLGRYPREADFWSGMSFRTDGVKQPSDNMLFAETNPKVNPDPLPPKWSMTLWWETCSQAGPYHEGLNDARHPRGGVIAFNDGHTDLHRSVDINPPGGIQYDPRSIKYWDPLQRRNR